MTYCAIDFGTSNSAVALPDPANAGAMRLAPVEGEHRTLPTSIFFNNDEGTREFGRAALASYIDGFDGRLMRSMKSILGSPLAEATTDLGDGSGIVYTEVIAIFLRHLTQKAQACSGGAIDRAVLGRPVFFVDDDPRADRLAEQQLAAAARSVGLKDVHFQYEPIAAAFDYESRQPAESLVLVADIGGGTSDFSLVRVGPERMTRLERKDDVLGHHGVHVAGTDYDRRVELASIMPAFGYRSIDPEGRELPNRIYFDLATWHLINTVYRPQRVMEVAAMRDDYADPRHHARLMTTLRDRLGHSLAGLAEEAKIAVAQGGTHEIDLFEVERDLAISVTEAQAVAAIEHDLGRIVQTARDTARLAGLQADAVDALYFTGGSTGLRLLADRLAAAFPNAQAVHGDRFASVATGLGLEAQRHFTAD
jgi:hypothetical chaperone protein